MQYKSKIRTLLLVIIALQMIPCLAWATENNPAAIVDTTAVYSYETLTKDLQELAVAYPELISYTSIGKTPYGREIWAVKLGKGTITVMFTGSIHAREWISTLLIMKAVETYANFYSNGFNLEGYNLTNILDKVSIWLVPMVNPDGVTLQQFGLNQFPQEIHKKLLSTNGGKTDFKRWKANAQGIDLNQQFPADWENKDTKVYKPWYWNYKGTKPLEAPEAVALAEFAEQLQPEILVNYHSSGNIIYWHSLYTSYDNLQETRRLASQVAAITKYSLVPASSKIGAAGFQDYFLKHFDRPALTIELNGYVGETNVPLKNFPQIWEKNKTVFALIAEQGFKLGEQRNLILQEIAGHEESIKQNNITSRSLTRLRSLYDKVGQKEIKVYINGDKLKLAVAPTLQNGSLLVPVRAITQSLGASVEWDAALNLVIVTKGETRVELTVNETKALVNDEVYNLNEPARLIKGNLLVPIRFLSEVFQMQVEWVPDAKMVMINSQE